MHTHTHKATTHTHTHTHKVTAHTQVYTCSTRAAKQPWPVIQGGQLLHWFGRLVWCWLHITCPDICCCEHTADVFVCTHFNDLRTLKQQGHCWVGKLRQWQLFKFQRQWVCNFTNSSIHIVVLWYTVWGEWEGGGGNDVASNSNISTVQLSLFWSKHTNSALGVGWGGGGWNRGRKWCSIQLKHLNCAIVPLLIKTHKQCTRGGVWWGWVE